MPLNEKTKNILSLVIRFALSFLLLWWLFQKIDVSGTVEVLKEAQLSYIVYSFLLFIVIVFLLLFRWFLLIKSLDLDVTLLNVTRYFFIGLFCNLFLPSAIGGDIVKTLGLCRNSSQKAKVVASVLLDRLSGFAGIVCVALVAFVFGFRILNDVSLLLLILALGFLSLMIFAVLFNKTLYSFGCRIFNKIPKVKQSLMNLHYDVVLIKDKRSAIYQVVGISAICQILLAVVYYLLAKGLQQDIGLIYFLVFSPMVCVATSLPSIGGLGVREVGWAYLLAKIGIAEGISVSLSLISFLQIVLSGLIGGVIYVTTVSSGRVQHHQSDPGAGRKET